MNLIYSYLVRGEHDEVSRDAGEALLLVLGELVVASRQERVQVRHGTAYGQDVSIRETNMWQKWKIVSLIRLATAKRMALT